MQLTDKSSPSLNPFRSVKHVAARNAPIESPRYTVNGGPASRRGVKRESSRIFCRVLLGEKTGFRPRKCPVMVPLRAPSLPLRRRICLRVCGPCCTDSLARSRDGRHHPHTWYALGPVPNRIPGRDRCPADRSVAHEVSLAGDARRRTCRLAAPCTATDRPPCSRRGIPRTALRVT